MRLTVLEEVMIRVSNLNIVKKPLMQQAEVNLLYQKYLWRIIV
jgi:hypothetical protein